MILLTTQTGFLKPIAWLLGQIFNGLFNLIYNIADGLQTNLIMFQLLVSVLFCLQS